MEGSGRQMALAAQVCDTLLGEKRGTSQVAFEQVEQRSCGHPSCGRTFVRFQSNVSAVCYLTHHGTECSIPVSSSVCRDDFIFKVDLFRAKSRSKSHTRDSPKHWLYGHRAHTGAGIRCVNTRICLTRGQ